MHAKFEKGMNPRDYIPEHRERGPVQFTYTLQDVADLFGVSKRTLRRWQADSADPFDPGDLADVCHHYHEHMLDVRERG